MQQQNSENNTKNNPVFDIFKQNKEQQESLFPNQNQNQNENNQDTENPEIDNQLKLVMQEKNSVKRVEIRKKSTFQLLNEKRTKLNKKRALVEFQVDRYRELINGLKELANEKIDTCIENINELSEFEYDSEGFREYNNLKQKNFQDYQNDENILDFIVYLLDHYRGYEKYEVPCYSLLSSLTHDSEICTKLIYTGEHKNILKLFINKNCEELRVSSMEIICNLIAEESDMIKSEMVKMNIFSFVKEQELIDPEYITYICEVLHNYSFLNMMPKQEIDIGIFLVDKLFTFVFKFSDSQENKDTRYELFLNSLVIFKNLIEVLDNRYEDDCNFMDVLILVDYILEQYTNYMGKKETREIIIEIFGILSQNSSYGSEFILNTEDFFVMLSEIEFSFIKVFTQCLKKQVQHQYMVINFLEKHKFVMETVIQKIAFQMEATPRERRLALRFLEALVDHTNNKIVLGALDGSNVEDAVSYNLDPSNDPSINIDEVLLRLEVIDGLIDHGKYENMYNQDGQKQQDGNIKNKFLARFEVLEVGKVLETLGQHQNEEIACRANHIYDTQFSDLYK